MKMSIRQLRLALLLFPGSTPIALVIQAMHPARLCDDIAWIDLTSKHKGFYNDHDH